MFEWIRRKLGGMEAPSPSREGTWSEGAQGGVRFRVDLHEQVLRLSIPDRGASGEPLATLPRGLGFVSGAVLAHKAKQIDDGLYAAVELAVHAGAGTFHGTRRLLERVLERLEGEGEARAILEAAAIVGGVRERGSPRAESMKNAFLADALRSKPLGFYTWTDDLTRIFRQDRMLQTDLAGASDLPALARALHADAESRGGYDAHLRLVERLTNPLACGDLRPMLTALDAGSEPRAPGPLAFTPPSIAHETDLVKKLFGARPIPENFDLASALVQAIRTGALDLTPREASGWYDVQTWALETLAAPSRALEAKRLVLDPSYERHLEKLFRAIVTSTRETHVKQLEMAMVTGAARPHVPEIVVAPRLSVEPLPTFYERRADSYRFVRALLQETFGEATLGQLRGLRPRGFAKTSLDEELAVAIHLFDGAAAAALRDLGIPTQRDASRFDAWAAALAEDPDLAADVRLMVPVYYDVERRKTKVWMLLGFSSDALRAEFAKEPRVKVLDDGKAPAVRYAPSHYPLYAPIMVEALVSRVLDRDEFRALCDRHRTPEAIVAALA